jgi:ABC-type antimicrobial peptide transport system permease subunit
MVDRLEAVPGVNRAGLSVFWSRYTRALQRKEDVLRPGTAAPIAQAFSDRVTPGFFDSIGVRLLRGRDFSWTDEPGRLPVAVVSDRLARAIDSGGDVLGKRIRIGPGTSDLEIVGVVADFRPTDIRVTDALFVFQSIGQLPPGSLPAITLQTAGSVDHEAIRRAVTDHGREYVTGMMPLSERVDRQLVRERVTAGLGAFVGALALLITATGLGSLLAFLVTARTPEFGLRLALGASPRSLWVDVIRRSLVLGGLGIALGVPVAMAAGRVISAVLIGVSPRDAGSLVAAGTLIMATTLVAGLPPALRAARVDPLVTLRSE